MEAQVRSSIEEELRKLRRDFEKAVDTVENLKKITNELERRLTLEEPEEAQTDSSSLESALNSIEELTDSEILGSKAAWKEYNELKHECQQHDLKIEQLDELEILCKRKEQFAADLLCYSLGRLKQKSK